MDQRQIFLRDILTTLFKRKLFIILFIAVVFALVFVGNYVWPPTYESMAKVQVTRGRETTMVDISVLGQKDMMPTPQLSTYDVNTVIDLVYSNDVLRKVVQDTGLAEGMTGGVMQMIRRNVRNLQYVLRFKTPPDAVSQAAEELSDAIFVEPVKDSYVLDIRVHMARAELAQKVLESLIKEFEAKHKEVYSTKKVGDYFEEQITRSKGQLEAAQKVLEDFRIKNSVVSLDAERDLLVDEYTKAKRLLDQLSRLEATAQAIGGDTADQAIMEALSQKTDQTVVTEIQLRLFDKVVERNQMVKSLGPKHPRVIGIKQEINELNANLLSAISNVRIETQAKMKDIDTRMVDINKLLGELDNLEREEKLAADAYELYSQRREEARVYDAMGEQGISSIQITSAPTLPDNPVSPRRLFNLIVALIGGLIGGVAIAFFLDYLDHGLKTPEDIEYYLKVPPMASFWRSGYDQLDPNQAQRLSALMEGAAMTAVASSTRGEGSLRVARALAEAQSDDPDARTLLVDFMGDGHDERPSGRGILEVLEGECSLRDVISQNGNLLVVGRGSRAECPAYLWKSDRMKAMFDGLRGDYERIIVHVPPILASHDAMNMARYSDNMLVVIKADKTRREVVQRALDSLGSAKAKVVGAVLVDRKQVIPRFVYRWI